MIKIVNVVFLRHLSPLFAPDVQIWRVQPGCSEGVRSSSPVHDEPTGRKSLRATGAGGNFT